jgi:L-iditol 2-dehydrogenase
VLVIGSGIAGLLHIHLAHTLGAGCLVATDIVDYRLEAALKFGADAAIHATEDVPARLRQVNNGRLADLVIVCTGTTPAIAQALQSVERGGAVLFFAPTQPGVTIPLPVNDLWFNGTTLTTSYAGSPADYAVALELIRDSGMRLREMITHRLSLTETGLGFQLVAQAQDSIKVIIEAQR